MKNMPNSSGWLVYANPFRMRFGFKWAKAQETKNKQAGPTIFSFRNQPNTRTGARAHVCV